MLIAASFAQSADGNIATKSGDSRWISGEGTLTRVHELRRDHDAIAVGIGTVLNDDPLLTCRIDGGKNPLRVLYDSRFRLPADSQIVLTAAEVPTVLFHDKRYGLKKIPRHLRDIEIIGISGSSDGLDLGESLDVLENMGIGSILLEGGRSLLTSFVKVDLIDRYYITIAPLILGSGIQPYGDLGVTTLDSGIRLRPRRLDTTAATSSGSSNVARAVYFSAPRRVEVREEEPVTGDPGTTLFTSRLMGISPGTEMLFFTGTFPRGMVTDDEIDPVNGTFEYPVKYGYINVARNAEGSRYFCFYPHQTQFCLPKEKCIVLPEDLPDEKALFLPSVETALGIVQDSGIVAGETVFIAGAGLIGLLAGSILSRSHWGPVLIGDIDRKKAPYAEAAGCSFLDMSRPGWKKTFIERSGCIDIGIDCSGSGEGLQDLIDLAAMEGTVVEASWFGGKQVSLNLGGTFHRKRLKIVSSQVSRIGGPLSGRWSKKRRMGAAMSLLRELPLEKFITHRFPLEDAQAAFETIADPEVCSLQVVLEPQLEDANV